MNNDEMVGKLLAGVARLEESNRDLTASNGELHTIVIELHRQVMRMRWQLVDS